LGRDEQFSMSVWPSQLLFHLDRQAYIEAAQIGIEVDKEGFEVLDSPEEEQGGATL